MEVEDDPRVAIDATHVARDGDLPSHLSGGHALIVPAFLPEVDFGPQS